MNDSFLSTNFGIEGEVCERMSLAGDNKNIMLVKLILKPLISINFHNFIVLNSTDQL